MTTVNPNEIIALIKRLPEAEHHIYIDEDGVNITNEWLVGAFSGRGFVSETEEGAAQELIKYLDRHIGHDSLVGLAIKNSGYPDLGKVEQYLTQEQ